ncbi:M15 family metallopeptidase [Streptococcus dentiloxodontae]
MTTNRHHARRRAKKSENGRKFVTGFLFIIALAALFVGVFVYLNGRSSKSTIHSKTSATKTTSNSSSTKTASDKDSSLPNVSTDDWELLLVNRDHVTEELNPTVTDIGGVQVDERIAEAVQEFLTAAQAIDSNFHLISGYRSVAYQEELYNSYVQQEMANQSIDQEAAEEIVQTYSQPPGASEHQTGLAIDMSTVDSLNEADADTMEQVQSIAADYGFILRFPEGKSSSTGVDYEDWHFRYVGADSAKYISEHNLTLEEYIALLKENGK